MDNYRDRIYANYVRTRSQILVPSTVEGLKSRAPYLRNLIRRHFPNDKTAAILDIGCGHGVLLHFAREAGYKNIRGFDRSPDQVEAARRLGIEGVEAGELNRVLAETPSESLDVVVAFDVVEHLTRDELLPLIDQVSRVLKVGGRWIIHAPNGESPFSGRMRYGDITHEISFTRMSIGQLLLSSGFTSVGCFEDAPIVHGFKSAIRWGLWKCVRGLLRLYVAAETGDLGAQHIFSQNFLVVASKRKEFNRCERSERVARY